MRLIIRAEFLPPGEIKVVKENKMKKIVLDLQSGLYAKLLERAMLQELDNHQIIISKTPNLTKDICEIHKPRVVIMEVTGYSPWMLNDRLELSNKIRKNNPECKIIFMTDGDANKKLADQIVKAKQSGYADSILFTSVSENFLAAVITSLENQE